MTEAIAYPARLSKRAGRRLAWRITATPELLGLVVMSAILNLWNLGINGWANQYYSAAVRSMTTSWHSFLFASLDPSGLMTVDKPPLALWVQALSVRVFGFHPLSLLVPQALMGMVAVGLIYDLVRRRFGRAGGFIAGFVLATTPIAVAISRHNNPDELLVLCSVAALWFAVRALETRRTRWLVFSGIAVGLGFETKMAVALMVVPGIAAAWMWTSSPGGRARLRALRQLLAGGLAMVVVGGAWPLLVTLTPASDRPWISGTSDNTIWSLIFGYNGLGRLAGQTGGPPGAGPGGIGPGGGGANVTFGGNTGPLRLLHTGLGDQAGWLLGFALVAGLGLLVASRLRRADSRTGWLIIVGGAFLTTAVAFSVASGIFHPYYVSLLAPFTAALVGAGAAMMLPGQPRARIMAPLALLAGAVTELIVLSYMGGSLPWARPLVIVVGGACAIALAFELTPRLRVALVAAGLVALLAAPATWAAQTLGHATNGTFPAGGPANAAAGGFGGPGGPGRFGGRHRFSPPGSGTAQLGAGTASGQAGLPSGSGTPGALSPGASGVPGFGPPTAGAGLRPPAPGAAGAGRIGGFAGPGGVGGSSSTLKAAVAYAKAHGGGTIGVESQGTAASLILSENANVAGLGGFSGRESTVSATWLAQEVRSGHLRWIVAEQSPGARLPGDTRTGSQSALSVVESACPAVKLSTAGATASATMYDCQGRAAAILAAAAK